MRLLSGDPPRGWPARALVALVVLGLAATPLLFHGVKPLEVAEKICVMAALAASYDVLLGYTGIVSFAHVMFFGIGAYGVGLASYALGPGWGALALGLAGGLSMGFSFLAMAMLEFKLGDAPGAKAIAPIGYAVGFLIVVLGKQQLFTESTLTAALPILHRPSLVGLGRLARMWSAVLVANLLGTIIFAWLISRPGLLSAPAAHTFLETARGSFSDDFWLGALRAVFSGWLIALIIWLLPASKTAAPFIIAALTYVVALAGFPHIIAGSGEAAYAVFVGAKSWADYGMWFLLPTLIGNTIGGAALAALLNHAPVAHDIAAREAEG